MKESTITSLRKAGRLVDAWHLADLRLQENKNDQKNNLNMAWVYYDFLKAAINKNKIADVTKIIDKINHLNISTSEHLFYDNCAWQIGKWIFNLALNPEKNRYQAYLLFESIKQFNFSKPEKSYSFLLKAFLKIFKGHFNFLAFVEWWGFENLIDEDKKPGSYNDKKVMSLAESGYLNYAKVLCSHFEKENDHAGNKRPVKTEKIKRFAKTLEIQALNYPGFLNYYLSRIYLVLEEKKAAFKAILPFVLQKQNQFWVWELMADIFSDDRKKQMNCLCTALTCKTKPEFLVKTRQKFIRLLVLEKKYIEAKTEIKLLVKTREANGWKIADEIVDYKNQDWYIGANQNGNNKSLYATFSNPSAILFPGRKPIIAVVEWVDNKSERLGFIVSKHFHGTLSYKDRLKHVVPGRVIEVHFAGISQIILQVKRNYNNSHENQKLKCSAVQIKISESKKPTHLIKPFSGPFKAGRGNSFGFINGVFIDSGLVKRSTIVNNQFVSGLAIISFNKKRNTWGYKAVELFDENKMRDTTVLRNARRLHKPKLSLQ
jgi:hypothetical protein